ncbi:uncharacterized protein LOC100114222 [Nasonia vitripennis]|uniref:Putative odorant binding protein 60 n=1 Tax=Nasonia vitripennis TaxID=7425 RepID=G8B1R5_NASVI|nr:uncharacterized protein LOC100114222 [Nasonia vitripennis]CCD17829.1 putative odorant binding protein 60 [Nasonia vitripennis]
MKIYVLCAVLFFTPTVFGIYSSAIWDALLHANEEPCGRSAGLSEESIESSRRARYLPESPEMNVFAFCVIRVLNIMSKDGKVNPDIGSYLVPTNTPDITKVISEKCRTHVGVDAGDTARTILNCYLQADQLVISLPSDAQLTFN